MTENEQIDVLQYLLGHENAVDKGTLDATNCLNSQEKEALKLILEEIQRYRAIGTPTQIYEKIGGLDVELGKYHSIGTIDEFKALKEKSVANETVENDAYLWSCKCPNCGKKIHRGSEERTFYCEQCGIQLHQRAFTEKELDEARFERQMDEYED